MKKNFKKILILLFLPLTSCIQTTPKDLGNKNVFTNPTDTSNSSNFRLRYAYRDQTDDSGGAFGTNIGRVMFLQGETGSASSIISTCNSSGTGCYCEFFTSGSDTATGTSTGGLSPEITYNSASNLIICKVPTSITATADVARVRLVNSSGTVATSITTVASSPTLSQILGSNSVSKLRTVSKYTCKINYIQNSGVTASPFAFTCGNSNLNYIQVSYKYYLYANNTGNNYANQMSDVLYNGGLAICALQIKQYDCTESTPSADFGLYAEASGPFDKAVSLTPNPSTTSSVYGYAVSPITVSTDIYSTSVCPPGMTKKELYTTDVSEPTEGTCAVGGLSTNISAAFTNSVVDASEDSSGTQETTAPNNTAAFDSVTGGSCNGSTCGTAPTTVTANCKTAISYSPASTRVPFCTVNSSYLP